MIATSTTRLFVTRTSRLRAAWRAVDPYTAGSLLVIALIIIGGLVRQALMPVAAPAPIIIFATSAPASGQHGLVRPQLGRAPASGRAVPTLVPTAEPAPIAAPAP